MRILLALAIALPLFGQANNPTQAEYLTNLNAALTQIDNGIGNKAQPKIENAGENIPWEGLRLSAAPFVFSPYINTFTDALYRIGVRVMYVNMWLTPLSADCTNYSGPVPSDCPNGTNCQMLAVYDSAMAHAKAIGMEVRIGEQITDDLLTACGLTKGDITSVTQANVKACLMPFYVAAVKRWAAAGQPTDFQLLEEPKSGFASSIGTSPWSVCDTRQFISDMSDAVFAANPNVARSVTASGNSAGFAPDSDHWQEWTGHTTNCGISIVPKIDRYYLDIFASRCDQSQTNVTGAACLIGTDYSFTCDLKKWVQNFISQVPAGKQIKIGQTQRPRWCPLSSTFATEAAADYPYEGALGPDWVANGIQQRWQDVFSRWAGAHGISTVSIFCTVGLFKTSTDPTQTNCSIGTAVTTALTTLSGQTAAGTQWGSMYNWNGRRQGRTLTQGRTKF